MKKIISAATAALFLLPAAASAHAHASYLIGGVQYDIVIGSLNEPVIVDDKTGLDLRVMSGGRMMMAEDGDMEPAGGKPAAGLEQSLQLEMISGDTKKTFDISPVYNTPGAYKTTFYPTNDAVFSYRIFGEIDGTPVDFTFTCAKDGETATHEGEKQISEGVKQLMKGGAFGCPDPKSELGFPGDAASLADVQSKAGGAGTWAIGLSVIALGLAAMAYRRK